MAPSVRDPEKILREVDAAIHLREIREWGSLKEALSPRFGEFFLLAGLFSFALGLILTLIFALPQDEENLPAYYFFLLWGAGYILMTMVCFEFLVRKFRVARRVIELNLRRLERLEKEIAPRRRRRNPEQATRKAAPPTE